MQMFTHIQDTHKRIFCLWLTHWVLYGYFIGELHHLFLQIKFKINHKSINSFFLLPTVSRVTLETLQDSSLDTCLIQNIKELLALSCSIHTFSPDFFLAQVFVLSKHLWRDFFLFFPLLGNKRDAREMSLFLQKQNVTKPLQ